MASGDSVQANPETLTLWTIEHTTRALDDCIAQVAANAIESVADVRRCPDSRA